MTSRNTFPLLFAPVFFSILVFVGPAQAAPARHIAAGSTHACATGDSQSVQCWGTNDYGQLGNGETAWSSPPVRADGVTGVSAVAAGTNHSCALAGGNIYCWGENINGQLGDGTLLHRHKGVPVSGIGNAIAVAAGAYHSCAILQGGAVQCWGKNGNGELGIGTTTSSNLPVAVPLAGAATALALGEMHSCALLASGQVYCWGYNGNGEVGNGVTGGDILSPVLVSDLSNATGLDAGHYFTCARLSTGQVRCWGSGGYGNLGYGGQAASNVPVAVSGIATATGIATGKNHACAVLADSSVRCWGYNGNQELGNGGTGNALTPVLVTGLNDAQKIAAGDEFTCVTTTVGGARCWGHNGRGQLGNGATMDSSTPANVAGLTSPKAIAASRNNTCVIDEQTLIRSVKCWGDNSYNQLESSLYRTASPKVIANSENADEIGVGDAHGCLRAGSEVKCWGANWRGQLGNGVFNTRNTGAAAVTGSLSATQISVGSEHSCAVSTGGAVFCWGNNGSGQIGNGNTSNQHSPIQVSGIATGATAVAAGERHSCAIVAGGQVKCWGGNGNGQLGDGSSTPRLTPVFVTGISDATAIAVSENHSCAVISNNKVKCWGNNLRGQLGDGTTDSAFTVRTVSGIGSDDPFSIVERASKLALGNQFSCAYVAKFLPDTKRIRCWGINDRGQLGNASGVDSAVPVTSLPSPVAQNVVAAGGRHACGLAGSTSPFTAKCWGAGDVDQLGGGANGFAPQAVALIVAPGAPTLTRLIPGNGSMRVVFSPPASTGGAAITGYTVSCIGNGTTRAASGETSPITITGLTNGASYSCSVNAENGFGTSSASADAIKIVRPASIAPLLGIILD